MKVGSKETLDCRAYSSRGVIRTTSYGHTSPMYCIGWFEIITRSTPPRRCGEEKGTHTPIFRCFRRQIFNHDVPLRGAQSPIFNFQLEKPDRNSSPLLPILPFSKAETRCVHGMGANNCASAHAPPMIFPLLHCRLPARPPRGGTRSTSPLVAAPRIFFPLRSVVATCLPLDGAAAHSRSATCVRDDVPPPPSPSAVLASPRARPCRNLVVGCATSTPPGFHLPDSWPPPDAGSNRSFDALRQPQHCRRVPSRRTLCGLRRPCRLMSAGWARACHVLGTRPVRQ